MSTNVEGTFKRVTAIAHNIWRGRQQEAMAQRSDTTTTVSDAIEVVTCYLIACERCRLTHHLEDSPEDVAFDAELSVPVLDAMQEAHNAVWEVIDKDGSEAGKARYVAAWDVWGCLNAYRMDDGRDGFAPLEEVTATQG